MTDSPQGLIASFVVHYRLREGAGGQFSGLLGDAALKLKDMAGYLGTDVHFDAEGMSPTVV